ncbi:hypothetical protein Bca52824_042344 [Brassica carinata]|uniref:tRNA (adenine(58)-N(1))-methyltransferase n=1 Tax=Brassica carinata TaxID=52824 RepID=A0A8X7RZ11_BRACI|nr:hypothetical protein Bca52824_042344 [Brassica carinata]
MKVFRNKGKFVYMLARTPELWSIPFVVMYLEVVRGCIFLESLWRQLVMLYSFDFHEQRAACASLVTIEVRDIKGQGFHEKLSGLADSVFLDLPQSWLAVPSAAKMLKEDGVLCSFSPCIEQVQRTCEVLRSDFIEVKEIKVETVAMIGESHDEEDNGGPRPSKIKHRSNDGDYTVSHDNSSSATLVVMARPCSEARGHIVLCSNINTLLFYLQITTFIIACEEQVDILKNYK